MNILFMGTPEFAKQSLIALIENNYNVIGVVTQPDKPQGRKMVLTPPPVKEYAVSKNIPVYQPNTVKNEDFRILLEKLNPDIIIVVAYGKILPEYVINYPKYKCINVHASLLPKHRGTSPINAAIMNGDKVTGITTILMDTGIDTGDMLISEEIAIGEYETVGELHDKMMFLGGKVLINTLDLIKTGEIVPQKQNDECATYASKITTETCIISFDDSSESIINKIRALSPTPGAYTYVNGKKAKLFDARKHISNSSNITANSVNGELVDVTENKLILKTSDGVVSIETIQVEGSKKMKVKDYLRGNKIEIGTIFGK